MLLAVPFLPTPIKNHKSFSSLKTQHFWHEEHHIKNDDVDIRLPNVFHSEIDDNKNTKSLTPPFLLSPIKKNKCFFLSMPDILVRVHFFHYLSRMTSHPLVKQIRFHSRAMGMRMSVMTTIKKRFESVPKQTVGFGTIISFQINVWNIQSGQ